MGRDEIAFFEPKGAIPPGDTVAELLRDHEITIYQLSDGTGLDINQIMELFRGALPIDDELAHSLSDVLGQPSAFWLNLEKYYQMDLLRLEREEEKISSIEFAKSFPLKEMIKLGWIPRGSRPLVAEKLVSFLGIKSWTKFEDTRVFATAFRKSATKSANNYSLAAWLRRGELEAKQIKTQSIDIEGVKARLGDLRALTVLDPVEFIPKLLSICGEHGIAVVFVPHLPGCYASGAAFKLDDRFVIQLSLLYKKNDHFWFSFFHELGHVVLHGEFDSFIDDFKSSQDVRERQADEFAATTLIPSHLYLELALTRVITRDQIVKFASTIGIHPGIVVGRLQHDRLLTHDRYPELKQTFEWTQKKEMAS